MKRARPTSSSVSRRLRTAKKREANLRRLGPDDAFVLQEKLLEGMLAATKAGVLRWEMDDPYWNNYSCTMPGTREFFSVRLLWTAFNEESSDRSAARITAPRFGPITVFGGTRAYELVWGIVTTAFPEKWVPDYFTYQYGKVREIVRELKKLNGKSSKRNKRRGKCNKNA